ncbi:MAG TPA: DUF885 domain-containing protein [Candidatus Acidoferrales bacterium]|nr:DUF885 domain-containing protein [Candidatus Acidoferrales bacterium]
MKLSSCIALILAVSLSCPPLFAQSAAVAGQNSPNVATRRLREFLAQDWKYWMQQYPEAATQFGYPGENARWSDYSPASIAARNRHLDDALKQLKAIPRAALPASEQLNYDLYDELLKTAIEGVRFHDDAFPIPSVFPGNTYMPVTQVQGPLQDIPNTIDMMPATNPRQYEDILARFNGVPTVIDQTIDMMKDGMAHGWTPPKITMRDVPKQAESQVFSDPLASPLLAAFTNYPPAFTAEQKADFTRRAEAAYKDKVAPSFQKLADFLTNTYIPACRESVSISEIPDGAAYYEYLVRWHTTTGMTPEQIHQIGLDLVKQTRAQMDALIEQTGFQGSFADFIKFVNTDPRFKFTSKDDMLLHYRATAKRADPELEHLFGKLPRLPYGVRAVPDAVAPSQTAAYYDQGAPDAARPGYLYVNTYDLASRPTWEMEDLILHEGVPGHHLQISLAQEMQGVPEFRKQLGYTAFIEGWALYSETLGPEMGFYTDPYAKFGFLSAVMWRAVRLVVDTGIHSMGWSRDRAIQYFEETTGQPHLNSVVEIDRYIVWPGQALGYMVGRLKIQGLRHDAEQALGDRFDIRSFHDAIVDQGALPMDLLESRTKQWIAEQKAKTPAG